MVRKFITFVNKRGSLKIKILLTYLRNLFDVYVIR